MVAVFVMVAGLGATVAAQQGPSSRALAITGVTVIDMDTGASLPDMTVVIRDGRIVSAEQRSAPDGAEVVDGRGKYLIPGLWDMHVHLSHARSSALPVLAANGVTGVRDMGSDLAEIDRWRTQIADSVFIGPTILRPGPILNGRESDAYTLSVQSAEQGRTAVRTLHKVRVDFIKVYRGLPREAFFAIVEEANSRKLPFSGHVPRSVSPAEASDSGQASIGHMETLFEGTFATEHAGENQGLAIAQWRATQADSLFAKFRANGTFVTPTLVANSQLLKLLQSTNTDPRTRYIARSAREEANRTLSGLRPRAGQMQEEFGPILQEQQHTAAVLDRAGVKLLAGTDLSYLHVPGMSLHDELALMVDSGITTLGALRAATVNPAEVLHLSDAGKIAAGMRADMVLLAANPLENIRNTQRIEAVVLRGRYMDRQTLDQVLEDAARLAESN